MDIFHRVVAPGRSERGTAPLPVLVLHGGPGVPHDYLLPLARLAAEEAQPARCLAFFDQPGCGRSAAPSVAAAPPGLYSVAGHVALVAAVARRLAEDDPQAWALGFHLLGQSWGGVLALEYALACGRDATLPRPRSAVLANTPADIGALHLEVERLMAELPSEVAVAMKKHEAAKTTGSPEYAAAVAAFYARHQCVIQPRPACVEAAFARGGNVWRGTGVIADWRAPPAAELAAAWPPGMPALLVSGVGDFVTPACVQPLAEALPGAEWLLMDGCSHMPHLEAPAAFDAALQRFWLAAEVAQES